MVAQSHERLPDLVNLLHKELDRYSGKLFGKEMKVARKKASIQLASVLGITRVLVSILIRLSYVYARALTAIPES